MKRWQFYIIRGFGCFATSQTQKFHLSFGFTVCITEKNYVSLV